MSNIDYGYSVPIGQNVTKFSTCKNHEFVKTINMGSVACGTCKFLDPKSMKCCYPKSKNKDSLLV